jgi:hypothetical protein
VTGEVEALVCDESESEYLACHLSCR